MADQLPTRFAPGRYGKTDGRPGVLVRERRIGLLASVIARRGAVPAAAAAIERLPDGEALTVPHPRLHERAFARWPLVDVAPFATDARGTPYTRGEPEGIVAITPWE